MKLKYANKLKSQEIADLLFECGYTLCVSNEPTKLYEINTTENSVTCLCTVFNDKTGTYYNPVDDDFSFNDPTIQVSIRDFDVTILPDGYNHLEEDLALTKTFDKYMMEKFGAKYKRDWDNYLKKLQKELNLVSEEKQ